MSDKKDLKSKIRDKLAEMKEERRNTIACGRCGVIKMNRPDSDFSEDSDNKEHSEEFICCGKTR